MKINKIEIKSGQSVDLGKFTVLVGPNNVGKSQTLKDIHAKLVTGPNAKSVLVKKIELEKPSTFDELISGLRVIEDPKNIDHQLIQGIGSNLTSGDNIRVQIKNLKQQFSASSNLDFTFGNISKFRVSYLDAGSRLQVTQKAQSHNPHLHPPQNLMQGLFADDTGIEDILRDAFKDTFGMDILLDYSGMTQLTMRVAKEFKNIPDDPRKAFPIFRKFNRIDEQGDGFRSFVGVVLSLLLSHSRIVLLDEPEAFLHPAQARKLGNWIAEHSMTVPGQIIVATHNANFLSGILSSGQAVDIYRINRNEDNTFYNHISSNATNKLSTSPILSSQRILESIFFKGVIVCEADSDRAIYQTVAVSEHQNQDMLFIHAHNKQTIPQVVGLLRAATIPVVAITDIDALDSSTDFLKLLKSIGVDTLKLDALSKLRDELANSICKNDNKMVIQELIKKIKEFLQQLIEGKHTLSGARGALNRLRKESNDWKKVKAMGINGFPFEMQHKANDLLKALDDIGLFLVPVGELENWIDLDVKQKNKWIVPALEALHDNSCPEKLKDFVRKVLNKLESPAGQTVQNVL